MNQIELILADFFRSELIGLFAEVLTELINMPGVGIDGAGREVADCHVFGHALDERMEWFAIGSHAVSPGRPVVGASR